ncbi:3-deoxy-D-manno-octulosonic acid transferase [Aquifex pyrophilus]
MKLSLTERLLIGKRPKGADVWFHVASIGEFNTARPLLKELKKHYRILLTFFSPRAKDYLLSQKEFYDELFPLPLDFPLLVRKFEEYVKPKVIIMTERELWPSLITFTKAPKVLINAYARGSLLERFLIKKFSLIITRTERDKEIFENYGAKKVVSCGNLKFICNGRGVNLSFGGKVIVAGSTHEGEEEIILSAFRKVKRSVRESLLIIAPRHVERSGELLKKAKALGFKASLFSEKKDGDVIVVDRFGILRSLYSSGDVAIVGGTFVKVGGHNLMEPACFGVPVLYGRYTSKVADLRKYLEENELGYPVRDEEELAERIVEILKNGRRINPRIKEESERIKKCYLEEILKVISSETV